MSCRLGAKITRKGNVTSFYSAKNCRGPSLWFPLAGPCSCWLRCLPFLALSWVSDIQISWKLILWPLGDSVEFQRKALSAATLFHSSYMFHSSCENTLHGTAISGGLLSEYNDFQPDDVCCCFIGHSNLDGIFSIVEHFRWNREAADVFHVRGRASCPEAISAVGSFNMSLHSKTASVPLRTTVSGKAVSWQSTPLRRNSRGGRPFSDWSPRSRLAVRPAVPPPTFTRMGQRARLSMSMGSNGLVSNGILFVVQ